MPYLSVDEYLARFGERETILLTNTAAPQAGVAPTFDSDKVEAAIEDATDTVDGYLGKRYALPIPSIPRIVKGWTAALARETLHVNTGKVSQAVQDAADRVRTQLRDASNGTLSLPLPEGGTETPSANQGTAAWSNDRPASTFSGNGALDDYVAPVIGSGYGTPCWRR